MLSADGDFKTPEFEYVFFYKVRSGKSRLESAIFDRTVSLLLRSYNITSFAKLSK